METSSISSQAAPRWASMNMLEQSGQIDEVAIEDGLFVGGEGAVEGVGQHGLALGAVCRVRRPGGLALPNWLKSATWNHLSFYRLRLSFYTL